MPILNKPISFLDIQTEFGGTNPISLNEYYQGGSYVPTKTGKLVSLTTRQSIEITIPTAGTITLDDFVGTRSRSLTILTGSGTFTQPAGYYRMTILVVAGGGSGGAEGSQWNGGGGGGAGGVIYVQDIVAAPGSTYSYSCGAGGAAVYNTQGTTGTNTIFGGYTAYGGGGGGGWNYSASNPVTGSGYDKNNNYYEDHAYRQFDGLPGGSGGGGSSYYGQGRAGAGTAGQGYDGGTGAYDNGYNGGGGGYGGLGYSTAQQTVYSGGIGGTFVFTINGVTSTTVDVAGGGGAGGGFEHPSYGGNQAGNRFARPGYGGGDGGYGGQSGYATPGNSAAANKGGGGGGAGGAYPNNSGNYYAGNGGSGVIYVLSYFKL